MAKATGSTSSHHCLHHSWVHSAEASGERIRLSSSGTSCTTCSSARSCSTSAASPTGSSGSSSPRLSRHTRHSAQTSCSSHHSRVILHHLHSLLHCLRVHHLLHHSWVVQHGCDLRVLLGHLLEHRITLNDLLHHSRILEHLLDHWVVHHLVHLVSRWHLSWLHSSHAHAWWHTATKAAHSTWTSESASEWIWLSACSCKTDSCTCGASSSVVC